MFWRVEDYRRVLPAYVRSTAGREFGSVVSLGEVQCRKTLLKTVDGEQHILLCDRQRVAQVRCLGDPIRAEAFAIELIVDEFPDVENRQRLVRRLADLYRDRRISGAVDGWTVEALRHRDALAALDWRSEGLSYREIAVRLCGEDAVREAWTNPDQTMKNRIVRSVKRGLRMMNGGYRALLT